MVCRPHWCHFRDPKHKKEKYLKELKKVMTDPGRDPGPLDDWESFEVL